MEITEARVQIYKGKCPCCGSRLEITPCQDNPEKVWAVCPGYPYCPTNIVLDKGELDGGEGE